MKSLSYFLICIASGSLALLAQHEFSIIYENQALSHTGQTLQSLSQALEEMKLDSGEYPESINGLIVDTEAGDFSHDVLLRVKYFKTESGYVAFVGRPKVSYIFPGTGSRHE